MLRVGCDTGRFAAGTQPTTVRYSPTSVTATMLTCHQTSDSTIVLAIDV